MMSILPNDLFVRLLGVHYNIFRTLFVFPVCSCEFAMHQKQPLLEIIRQSHELL